MTTIAHPDGMLGAAIRRECSALFFEDDVLAGLRVVLAQLDPLSCVRLVLARDVRVAGSGRRLQLDDRTLVALGHPDIVEGRSSSTPIDELQPAGNEVS